MLVKPVRMRNPPTVPLTCSNKEASVESPAYLTVWQAIPGQVSLSYFNRLEDYKVRLDPALSASLYLACLEVP